MKIERQHKPPIIIGKRVVLGQIVLATFNVGAGFWDWMNPDNPVPALLVGGAAQVVTGIAQIIVVNKYGATTTE